MSIALNAAADGLSATIQLGGVDAMKIDSPSKTVSAVAPYIIPSGRNILINANMAINQRGVTIAAAVNGAYGPDRWKKVDASNMTQIVESDNFKVSTVHTLSGTGITTAQITSPASGNWTLPNIPITATNIKLEEGYVATPFSTAGGSIGAELALCQRYYRKDLKCTGAQISTTAGAVYSPLNPAMRVASTNSDGIAIFIENVGTATTPAVTNYTYSTAEWFRMQVSFAIAGAVGNPIFATTSVTAEL
jgi:hypothetical protein